MFPIEDYSPEFDTLDYAIPIRRFFNALMLGVVTSDAKLLVIRPRASEA